MHIQSFFLKGGCLNGDISSSVSKTNCQISDIKLTKDNPSVTKEMVNSFLYEISKLKRS